MKENGHLYLVNKEKGSCHIGLQCSAGRVCIDVVALTHSFSLLVFV